MSKGGKTSKNRLENKTSNGKTKRIGKETLGYKEYIIIILVLIIAASLISFGATQVKDDGWILIGFGIGLVVVSILAIYIYR